MEGYVRVAGLEQLEPHGQFTKWVDNHDLLVYRLGSEIKCISNVCRHFGGPIGYHKMREGRFTCLWHNFVFDAKDGSCLTAPKLGAREYKLKVHDGAVWVKLVEN